MQRVRDLKVQPVTATLDKGYDTQPVRDACHAAGILPVIPLKATPGVKRGDHKPSTCEHGTWTFAGADYSRNRAKWCCPTGQCEPNSVWHKASRLHPLIPRDSKRFGDLYRDAEPPSACSAGSRTSAASPRNESEGSRRSSSTPTSAS